mgnify:FL=1
MLAVKAIITGRVQGVWYRAWTEGEAAGRGLNGWVRNRSDGTVEAVFSGTETEVAAMLDACKTGPRLASVKEVFFEPCDPPPQGFTKRPSE